MSIKSISRILVSLTLFGTVVSSHAVSQEWRPFGSMEFERLFHEVAVMIDGRILIAGGQSGSPITDCRIIDPARKTLRKAAEMIEPRSQFSLIAMPDGKVYAAGGYSRLFSQNPSIIEAYDPATDTWQEVGSVIEPRGQTSIVAISNEEFMIVGGRIGGSNVRKTCEVFNTRTGQSRLVAEFPYPTSFAKSFVHTDGRILSGTGRSQGPGSFRSDIFHEYDPRLNRWTESVKSTGRLYYPTMVRMVDGEMAMVGGSWTESTSVDDFSVDVAVLNGNEFVVAGRMQQERAGAGAVDMGDGRAMAIGGSGNDKRPLASCEFVDVATGEVSDRVPNSTYHTYFTSQGVPIPKQSGVVVFAIGGTSGATMRSE